MTERDKIKRRLTYLRHKHQRAVIALKAAKRRADAELEPDEFTWVKVKRLAMQCEAIEVELWGEEALMEEAGCARRDE